MADLTTVLSAVLGVALGLVFLAAPQFVVRTHTLGRTPRSPGDYGNDDGTDRWHRLVQAVGVALVAAGVYFGLVAAGVV